MTTVDRIEGFRIVIYSNDHRPDHVHVIAPDMEAVFYLNCPQGPPSLRENFGCPGRVLRKLRLALAMRLPNLCEKWEQIHGKP